MHDQLIINIINYNIDGHLHFEDVVGGILEEDSKQKNIVDMEKSSKQVEDLTMIRDRSIECGSSGSQTHDRSKPESKKYLKCYHCSKMGHAKKDYWHRKNGGKNSISQGYVASTLKDKDILVQK